MTVDVAHVRRVAWVPGVDSTHSVRSADAMKIVGAVVCAFEEHNFLGRLTSNPANISKFWAVGVGVGEMLFALIDAVGLPGAVGPFPRWTGVKRGTVVNSSPCVDSQVVSQLQIVVKFMEPHLTLSGEPDLRNPAG